MVADVVMGIDGLNEKGRFSTFCTVNVAYAFTSGVEAGFLLSYLRVIRCDAGAVFAFFSSSILFGQQRLVVACSCPQFAHLSVRFCCPCIGGSDVFLACPGMVAELLATEARLRPVHKGPYSEAPVTSVNLAVGSFSVKTTFTMYVWFANFVLLFHFVIRVASSTFSHCRRSSSVMQDGTPNKI